MALDIPVTKKPTKRAKKKQGPPAGRGKATLKRRAARRKVGKKRASKTRPLGAIPQAPNLGKLRLVLQEMKTGSVSTKEISTTTGISTRHVNYLRHAAAQLGLTETRDGPVTPAGRKVLRANRDSPTERQAFIDAISTSPMTEKLGIDVVSLQPPDRQHFAERCKEVAPGLAEETLGHRVGDMFSWRQQLGLDLEPPRPRQLQTQLALQFGAPLPLDAVANLHRTNPWWHDHGSRPLPLFQRSFVREIEMSLENDLVPIVVVRGPRQVGKTTAQEQIIKTLLSKGIGPQRILRIQFDGIPSITELNEPILRFVDWFEQNMLNARLNVAAQRGLPAFIFLDEVQNVSGWANQLKYLVDASRVHVVVTGSSALRIEEGQDSLAGRVHTIDVGTLTLAEIAQVGNNETLPTMLANTSTVGDLGDVTFWRDLVSLGAKHRAPRDRAFERFSDYGGYPLAHTRRNVPWEHVAKQLHETIVRRVIRYDLRAAQTADQREHSLTEEVFRLCCRYAGQTPSTELLTRELTSLYGPGTTPSLICEQLKILQSALLLRLVKPLEFRAKRAAAPWKLCLIDHALRASWFGERVPLTPQANVSEETATLAGHIAESVVGACLLGAPGLNINYLPERPGQPEVDFVITAGNQRIPLEVKFRSRVREADFEGLKKFTSNPANNAPFGIMVTQAEVPSAPDNVVVVPLPTFLMLR
jgi:predicted AAA+ superfamily ATPase